MAKRLVDEISLTTVANAIREKTGESDPLVFPEEFVTAINGINTGGSGGGGESGGSDDFEWIKDGNTHIWISLTEGRTSPMLGVCPNGTVTVDWGDETTPDVLTGTSTSTVAWTPTHNYASAGDYIITLTVDGEMGFYGESDQSGLLRYSNTADSRNVAYSNSIARIELGLGVTSVGSYAFRNCNSLTSIVIPEGVTSIGGNAFHQCYSLTSIVIPEGVTSIISNTFCYCYSLASVTIPKSVRTIGSYAFQQCYSLTSIVIPEGVTSIDGNAFDSCYSLASIVISESVKSIGSYAFKNCYSLASVVIPEGVTSIGKYAFCYCYSLASVTIPKSVKSIGNQAFMYCSSLTSIVIPEGVTSIGSEVFYLCYSVAFYDFSTHTSVPTLSKTSAFSSIQSDCEIRVPAALYDEWIAATNWSTYADYIVAV